MNGARFDNCIRGCARGGIYRSICFTEIIYVCTFSLSLAAIETWFLDFDREILLIESSERSI